MPQLTAMLTQSSSNALPNRNSANGRKTAAVAALLRLVIGLGAMAAHMQTTSNRPINAMWTTVLRRMCTVSNP